MLNNVMVVGKFVKIEDKTMILSVASNEKNENGEYFNYNVSCTDNGGSLLEKAKEYVNVGGIVGVKGHLEDNNVLIIEKLTFLSSGKASK